MISLRYWTLVVRPEELQVAGKTGEFDHTVIMDLDCQQLLVPFFMERKKSLGPMALQRKRIS